MVHFDNAPLTNTAVVCTIGFNTTTFRTFKEHFALSEAQLLDHFLGSVALWNGTLFDYLKINKRAGNFTSDYQKSFSIFFLEKFNDRQLLKKIKFCREISGSVFELKF
jgi:hypothetical protein